ncbi:MAG: polyprenyl synthetase family protein, partial [Candidatus Promineifilaceae bacterium]
RLITSAGYPAEISNQICDCLAEVAAATAYGQQLDVQNLRGEEAYWRVIHAKSTPFYAGALKTGGMAAGGQAPQLAALAEFGTCIGEMIQLEDDLNDALQTPANADWGQGRNNLVILYARTAEHPGRQRFVELLTKIGANGALEEAQQLLFTSGAVSYCAYLLVSRFGRARRMLAQAQLPNAAVLAEILDQYSASLLSLLRLSGIDLAPQFLESFQSAPAGDPPRSRPPSA